MKNHRTPRNVQESEIRKNHAEELRALQEAAKLKEETATIAKKNSSRLHWILQNYQLGLGAIGGIFIMGSLYTFTIKPIQDKKNDTLKLEIKNEKLNLAREKILLSLENARYQARLRNANTENKALIGELASLRKSPNLSTVQKKIVAKRIATLRSSYKSTLRRKSSENENLLKTCSKALQLEKLRRARDAYSQRLKCDPEKIPNPRLRIRAEKQAELIRELLQFAPDAYKKKYRFLLGPH